MFSSKIIKPTKQLCCRLNDPSKINCNRASSVFLRTIYADRGPHRRNDNGEHQRWFGRSGLYLGTAVAASSLVASFTAYKRVKALKATNEDDKRNGVEDVIFTKAEVSRHNSLEQGVWITYKGNVYDISEFVKHHPGGSHTIMLGAGGDVEPFWQTYTVHHASEVQALLSRYRIGKLAAEDQINQDKTNQVSRDEDDPYLNDPKRNPLLRVHTQKPFNAETPQMLLISSYLTPEEIFFVRNHLPVPEIDLKDYKLSICFGTDGDPDNLRVVADFTLDDLKTKFKPHTVESVIQCSGNRRSDLKKFKEIKGLDWGVGAIGNAKWTGVKLLDILESLNIEPDKTILHVQLEGLDCDMTGQTYGASISSDIAFDPNREVILAYEMNDKPLSMDRGFPLRFVAPGVTGARNVKWLSKVILSTEESNSHWQRNDYKSFSPNIDLFNVDFKQSISIQETPVQSAICYPSDGDVVNIRRHNQCDQLTIPVKGYAYSGGGKMIVRVDVSVDGGASWHTADLDDLPSNAENLPDYTKRNQTYSWTRWSTDIPIPEVLLENQPSQIEIICRAFDSSYNSQPERAETIWNVRGVVNNSWHKIRLNVKLD